MIRNIIFDIGNVLTDFRWKGFLEDQGFGEEMVERIARASVYSDTWCEFDRGVWETEQVIAAFVQNDPGIEREIYKAYADFAGMVTPRAYAIPWIKELKEKGYSVYYLSNFAHKAEVECADALTFMPYMDGGILSYRDKIIKPNAEIYELILSRYGLVAEESVFLDDTLANVEAAERAGIHGILFETKEQAEADLRKLGVAI